MNGDIVDPFAASGEAALFPSCGPVADARLRRRRGGDALDLHGRLIAAWCEDLASPEFRRTGRTPRADAVCEFAGSRRPIRRI